MDYLALMIGNSRLHWGKFQGKNLEKTWDTPHLLTSLQLTEALPLYLASVVPHQTALCLSYPHVRMITLEQIPLQELYSTLGIDRVLAVWGGGITYRFPCLVIDAGTALTFTGVNQHQVLIGGAILPGLNLQFQSLYTQTAALPQVNLPTILPPRWAKNTPEAIESGIIYTVLTTIKDFIEDWLDVFPETIVLLTGGDAKVILKYLQLQFPKIAQIIHLDTHLIFWGMRYFFTEF